MGDWKSGEIHGQHGVAGGLAEDRRRVPGQYGLQREPPSRELQKNAGGCI